MSLPLNFSIDNLTLENLGPTRYRHLGAIDVGTLSVLINLVKSLVLKTNKILGNTSELMKIDTFSVTFPIKSTLPVLQPTLTLPRLTLQPVVLPRQSTFANPKLTLRL